MSNRLTHEQQQFVRTNYTKMQESEMALKLNTTRFFIQKFKRQEGLRRNGGSGRKKAVLKEGYFNVHAKENWVA